MRYLTYIAAFAAMLLTAPVLQAGTVTTNDYKSGSTSSTIDESCKDLDFNTTTNSITGTCNTSGGGTKTTSLNLNSHARCTGGTLEWGTSMNDGLTGENYLASPDVEVSSNGKNYGLTGTCSSNTGATDAAQDTLALSDKVKNSLGDFKMTTTGR